MSDFFERDSSNLRPSELPNDTVIEPDDWGRWIKINAERPDPRTRTRTRNGA